MGPIVLAGLVNLGKEVLQNYANKMSAKSPSFETLFSKQLNNASNPTSSPEITQQIEQLQTQLQSIPELNPFLTHLNETQIQISENQIHLSNFINNQVLQVETNSEIGQKILKLCEFQQAKKVC